MDGSHQNRLSKRGQLYVRMRNHNIVEFLDPTPEQIRIDDIAWHLARECRFTGAVKVWYSNAEHCIQGSYLASNNKVAREFLLHDAAEYVFNDVSSPVGAVCPDYKKHCHAFQNYLYRHFLGYDEIDNEVKIIDKRLCATEMRDVRHQPREDYEALPYLQVRFQCWEWAEAYSMFKTRFFQLFPEHTYAE